MFSMGERSLSEAQVLSIPDLLMSGMTWAQAADHLGISRTGLARIISGEAYKESQARLQKKLRLLPHKGDPLPAKKRCTKCGKMLPNNKKHFQPIPRRIGFEAQCRKCKSDRMSRRYQEIRKIVLEHYSGGVPECACCGEIFIEFLSIDHIHGGGTRHRREVINGKYNSLYLWLLDKGLPEGYRVLCMNCNVSLGHYGYCPHQGG